MAASCAGVGSDPKARSRPASRSKAGDGMGALAPVLADTVGLLECRNPTAHELLTCRLGLAEHGPDLPGGKTGCKAKDDCVALVRCERCDTVAQLGRVLICDEPRLRPYNGIGRSIGRWRRLKVTSVVDRGVASDTEKPRPHAGATGPVARDRDEGPLEGERRQVGRVVLVGCSGPQVAVHGRPVPHVERLERRDFVLRGEGEIVFQIEAASGIEGDVFELLHPGRPYRAGSSSCITNDWAASGQGSAGRASVPTMPSGAFRARTVSYTHLT